MIASCLVLTACTHTHVYDNGKCICGDLEPSTGLEYILSDDETSYSVVGIGLCTDKDIVIPSVYNDKPVTNIGYCAFYGCTSLTSITIPSSVTSIGDHAFQACTSLTSITIPSSVTSIGTQAFFYCTGLTNITIPSGVTSIGDKAFYGCSGLTSITIPSSVTNIGDKTFQDCTSLTSITIPSSVKSIGNSAFFNCSGLTNVTFEDPNGWYCTQYEGATSGKNLTLTDPSQNAIYLRSYDYYSSYYWYKAN